MPCAVPIDWTHYDTPAGQQADDNNNNHHHHGDDADIEISEAEEDMVVSTKSELSIRLGSKDLTVKRLTEDVKVKAEANRLAAQQVESYAVRREKSVAQHTQLLVKYKTLAGRS